MGFFAAVQYQILTAQGCVELRLWFTEIILSLLLAHVNIFPDHVRFVADVPVNSDVGKCAILRDLAMCDID